MKGSRAFRTALAGLAALGVSVASIAAQAGDAYGAASAPTLTGVVSAAVEQTSAELIARVDPGEAATSYRFEYGTSAAYGASVPAPDGELAAGGETVAVGQQLTDLQPNSTYHYRIVASNEAGEAASGDQTFTTPPPAPPRVGTGQAEAVTQNGATLTATVDASGFETTYELDLGADTGYGIRIFGDAGSEVGVQTFRAPLQGLAPGTTYHYRVSATNAFGTVYGADETFTTSAYPSATLAPPVAPPLLPAILLAPEPSTVKASAAAAHASLVQHAPNSGGRAASRRTHKRKGGRR